MEKIVLNRKEILEKYMHVVNTICDACDWKSTFEPEEIVDIICAIIEGKDNHIVKAYESLIETAKEAVALDFTSLSASFYTHKDYYGSDTTSSPN